MTETHWCRTICQSRAIIQRNKNDLRCDHRSNLEWNLSAGQISNTIGEEQTRSCKVKIPSMSRSVSIPYNWKPDALVAQQCIFLLLFSDFLFNAKALGPKVSQDILNRFQNQSSRSPGSIFERSLQGLVHGWSLQKYILGN